MFNHQLVLTHEGKKLKRGENTQVGEHVLLGVQVSCPCCEMKLMHVIVTT